jgi:hypothetical protein
MRHGERLPIPQRAISAKQKRDVMERILKVWEENPEMRLGQLLINSGASLFYAEDFSLAETVEDFNRDLKKGK